MLLKDVLEANSVKRNTYNSLVRRPPGLPFMKRGLVEGKRGDRYTFTHVIALGTMLAFQKMGIEAGDAAEAVDAVYDMLIDWAGMFVFTPNDIKVEDHWLTISKFADGGLGWASGKEGADTFSAEPAIVKLSVNVAVLANELWPRTLEIIRRDRELPAEAV